MILYINGDSHTAAAEAVNPHVFAEDDGQLWGWGKQPHPDNLQVSFGKSISNALGVDFVCQAESASSNDRIIRTCTEWIDCNPTALADVFMLIQWSTWERQEWLIDGQWYQINASGMDDVPASHRAAYKEFIAAVDWDACTRQAHDQIWQFHTRLCDLGIPHVFFNGNNHFETIVQQRDWGVSYMHPYDPTQTYDQVLRNNGFKTVNADSWHFGPDAHCFWAKHVLQYLQFHNLVPTHALSFD